MAEQLIIRTDADKATRYRELLPQAEALIASETDVTANLANIAAALRQTFNFFWVGFYLVKNDELVLGPFQGPVACTRISYGRGVCGTSWQQGKTIVVPDVELFPGHIACSSESRSEIVVPGFSNGKVKLVLDVDSQFPSHFDEVDALWLEELMRIIERKF
ncbi:MAG: GAF domain-containing protein [Cyclobacteriaceae bacterium]